LDTGPPLDTLWQQLNVPSTGILGQILAFGTPNRGSGGLRVASEGQGYGFELCGPAQIPQDADYVPHASFGPAYQRTPQDLGHLVARSCKSPLYVAVRAISCYFFSGHMESDSVCLSSSKGDPSEGRETDPALGSLFLEAASPDF
jgi:hypothetical protein